MNRRKAVQRVAWILGGSVLGADLFIQSGCKSGTSEKDVATKSDKPFFGEEELTFIEEVAETIIPRTDTPGAKDAKVGAVISVLVGDCYSKADQKIFKEGLDTIEKLSKDKYSAGFMKLQPAQRTELLTALDNEQRDYQNNKKDDDPDHYFRMMRELTLLAYFTSEPGATKTLRYVAIPGKFEPCIPYTKGDRAWAVS